MRQPIFIESLINSWLRYIEIEDVAAACVPKENIHKGVFKVPNENVRISGSTLLLEKGIFEKLKEECFEKSQKGTPVLSFPRILVKDKYRPLFIVDLQEIFRREYKEEGWDLSDFEFAASTINIKHMLPFDDEDVADISSKCGLLEFLSRTIGTSVESMVGAISEIKLIVQELNPHFKIDERPYLFLYQGSGFNINLRNDFEGILKYNRQSLNSENLAVKYISNKTYEAPSFFVGALGKKPPTPTQSLALYHNSSSSITAVQGPPGSGKTTLIMNVVASQITKRALELIKNKREINNITVITSTNRRAVNNAVEKLVELNEKDNSDICLIGGNKEYIKDNTIKQIEKKIKELERLNFDERKYSELRNNILELSEKIQSFPIKAGSAASKIAEMESVIESYEAQCEEIGKVDAELRRSILYLNP